MALATPTRAPGRPRARGIAWAALLTLLCLAPHLLRMSLRVMSVADGFYAHAAWMMSQGHAPYVQFTQVAFPLAEAVLAAVFAVCGHDVRVVGACNLCIVLAVAATLNAAARRMVRRSHETARRGQPASAGEALATERAARRAGAVAALAWSWSAWVVNYDMFERETWAALGTALAPWAPYAPRAATGRAGGATNRAADATDRAADATNRAADATDRAADATDRAADATDRDRGAQAPPSWRRAWAIAGGMAVGFWIKITAVIPAGAMLGHLALTGRWRQALRAGLAFLALAGTATLLCWWAWGTPFLQQVFLFGFFRSPNTNGPLDVLQYFAHFTDPVLALALAALAVHGLPRLLRPEGAPACMLLADLLFFVAVSPTVWDHNCIGLVPASAMLLGSAAAAFSGALALRMALGTALVVAAVIVLPAAPFEGLATSPLGLAPWFRGYPREAVDRTAEFIRRYTRPGDVVCTLQPIYALQAGRAEFVRYLDLQELALDIEAAVERDGLLATWAARRRPLRLGAPHGPRAGDAPPASGPITDPEDPRLARMGHYAGRMLSCGLAYDRPLLLDALAHREIALVVEPLPPLSLTVEDLQAAGYRRVEEPPLHCIGWRPPGGVGRRVVRDLFPR
ncbi:MAG TPA: hypothetical protein VK824_06830 [Planctomycetota bacterium]|nr:hypothetical protein [Planctomycetota bacterium]